MNSKDFIRKFQTIFSETLEKMTNGSEVYFVIT